MTIQHRNQNWISSLAVSDAVDLPTGMIPEALITCLHSSLLKG